MKPDIAYLSLSTAFEHLRRREYSALDLTETCIHQIERLNPAINAFIAPTPELAIQGALQADVLLARKPSNLNELALLGLPIAIKDMIDVAGLPTKAGSIFFSESLPVEDAQVVRKLRLMGALILGKTNTHEIALGVTGINPHHGTVKNPWDLTRISGGSSSGSAAAVASRMCLAAIGTDTGGSVRIPAALCGVVGLKPSYGRISTRGVIPLSWNLDHVGSLTRSVRDAAVMLSIMGGFDPHDPASVNVPKGEYLEHIEDGVTGWRIAVAEGSYVGDSDPEILLGMERAAQTFKDMGARVEKVETSWLKELALANGQMTQADGAAFHRQRLKEHPQWFGVDVLQRLQNGAALSSSDYVMARRAQVDGCRRFENFFQKFDILLLPTTPIPAPPIEDTSPIEAAKQLTRFTAAFNLVGLPALSIPCGFTKTGLPIGLQIVSNRWAEIKVFQAGHSYEKASEWHQRLPEI